jgi:hypothetical protein
LDFGQQTIEPFSRKSSAKRGILMAKRQRAADVADEATAGESAPVKSTAPRLSLQLTEDGSRIAWDSVRAATVDKLRSVLAGDADAVAKLGAVASSAAATPASGLVDPQLAGMAVPLIGNGIVLLAQVLGGLEKEQAEELRYTPDEAEAVKTQLAKVLSKHGASLGKWEDEIMLAVAISLPPAMRFHAAKAKHAGSGATPAAQAATAASENPEVVK